MNPWLSADLADQRRTDARRAAQNWRARPGQPRPPSRSAVWVSCFVPVPYDVAVLTLPLSFRSSSVQVELAPVLLTPRARPPERAVSLRVLVRWRGRWRSGTGHVEMTDAGLDGTEVVLHLAARKGRRLGGDAGKSTWSLLTELRCTIERAALVASPGGPSTTIGAQPHNYSGR